MGHLMPNHTPTTPEQRAELLALAEKATPRPWAPILSDGLIYSTVPGSDDIQSNDGNMSTDDVSYIAAACNIAPALAREVEGLRRDLAHQKRINDSLTVENNTLRREMRNIQDSLQCRLDEAFDSGEESAWLDSMRSQYKGDDE